MRAKKIITLLVGSQLVFTLLGHAFPARAADETRFGVVQVDPQTREYDLVTARAVVKVGGELRLVNFCSDLEEVLDCDTDTSHITLRITRHATKDGQVAYAGKKGSKTLDLTINRAERESEFLTVAVFWKEWFGVKTKGRLFENFAPIDYGD